MSFWVLAATEQLYEHYCLSDRPSVRPSVTPFPHCLCHRLILKFSGLLTIDKRIVHVKGQGRRSKIKVTEVKVNFVPSGLFQTITPVWIYRWLQYEAHSLKWHRRAALLCFKVISQFARSQGTKKSPILSWIGCFRIVTPVRIHWWLWNDAQSLPWYRRGLLLILKVIRPIGRSRRAQNCLCPELSISGL